MFFSGKNIVATRQVLSENFREDLLSYFNRKELPIKLSLEADVKTLPATETEKILFIHPYNLADDITEKMNEGKIETACICFNDSTSVLEVILGKDIEVQIHMNRKNERR